MTTLPPPTDEIARLVELIGPEAALRLVEARGGARVYVCDPAAGGAIVDIIGVDATTALHARYGADTIKVPIARPWRVLCYLAMGLSQEQAALKAGCSRNSVQRALDKFGHPDGRAGRPATSQLDMFDKAG